MIVIFTLKEDDTSVTPWLRIDGAEPQFAEGIGPYFKTPMERARCIEAIQKEYPGALLLPPEQFDAWTSFFTVVDATIKIATKTLFYLSDGKHIVVISVFSEHEKYSFYDIVPGEKQDFNFFRNGAYFVTDATRRDDVESIAKGNGIDLSQGWKWIQETEDDRAYRQQHNINR